jgi:DNA-binding SARP family transcriptional activator
MNKLDLADSMSSPARTGGVVGVDMLGPLVVSVDGRPVEVSAPKLRTLLVVLAMEAGSPVSLDRLATAVWNDNPPAFLFRTLHTYLTRLRAVLGSGSIVTESAGYRLRVKPEMVDALMFGQLLDAAVLAPDIDTERRHLAQALELWRGDPLDNLSSAWFDSLRAKLVERYLAALERWIDLELAEGRHSELVPRLRELTSLHPLRESLWVRLLTALDRSGRQADALAAYESIRRRLAEDLGVDPGPDLRRIHTGLLGERSAPPEPAPTLEKGYVVPRQLPTDIDGFTGRTATLKALHGSVHEPRTGATIVAITGMAGVGKTTLVVHWAHQIAHRFPDGQLYVNLRGYHPSGQAMTPEVAIRGFLDALGVPAPRIPKSLHAQIGLYRSLLSDRRMLVVLDNARDARQARPLLPGSPTCVAVVTSRSRLTGLVATEAAWPLVVEPLSADDARSMLAARLGWDRIAAESHAADAIIGRCGGLPLALAVSAARVATSGLPLEAAATQLDEQSALDPVDAGDPVTDMRLVFSWSYQTLSRAAARLFRLLGLHPGPDIAATAAASLAGTSLADVRPLLAELCLANLLTEHSPGRYALHDLLRCYATELAYNHDDDAERRAAEQRLLDHYLHTANSASLLTTPHRTPITIAPPLPDVTTERLTGHEDAIAWYTTEHHVLLTAITHAAGAGFDTHAWQLAWAVSDFLYHAATGMIGATSTSSRCRPPNAAATGEPKRSPAEAWPWPLPTSATTRKPNPTSARQ